MLMGGALNGAAGRGEKKKARTVPGPSKASQSLLVLDLGSLDRGKGNGVDDIVNQSAS